MYGCLSHACGLSKLAKSSGVLLLLIKTVEFGGLLLFVFAIGFKELQRVILAPRYSVFIAEFAITALCLFGQMIFDLFIVIDLFKGKQGYLEKFLGPTATLYTIQCCTNIFSLLYHAYYINGTTMNITTTVVSVTIMLISATLLLEIRKFYIAVKDGNIKQTTGSKDESSRKYLTSATIENYLAVKMYGCLVKSSGILLLLIKTVEFGLTSLYFPAISFKHIDWNPTTSIFIGVFAIVALCLFGQMIFDFFIAIDLCVGKQGYLEKFLGPTAVLYSIESFMNILSFYYFALLADFESQFIIVVPVIVMLLCATLLLVIRNFYIGVRDGNHGSDDDDDENNEPSRKFIIML